MKRGDVLDTLVDWNFWEMFVKNFLKTVKFLNNFS
jgi:hypothetical protein